VKDFKDLYGKLPQTWRSSKLLEQCQMGLVPGLESSKTLSGDRDKEKGM
jgi:hypothetical protein